MPNHSLNRQVSIVLAPTMHASVANSIHAKQTVITQTENLQINIKHNTHSTIKPSTHETPPKNLRQPKLHQLKL